MPRLTTYENEISLFVLPQHDPMLSFHHSLSILMGSPTIQCKYVGTYLERFDGAGLSLNDLLQLFWNQWDFPQDLECCLCFIEKDGKFLRVNGNLKIKTNDKYIFFMSQAI
uniref:Uncharacterized protein n=1 Tax=Meloidogyne enterolobii TaxID=390850 RepID=A0A6V7VG47_MELEN|nr:unnamed protein product [Meloidogyne enterolobii]